MLVMRFLLPKLMEAKNLPTAYALERYSKGALPITTATRLVKAGYKPKRIDLDTLDVLCDIFNVGPGELLERDRKPVRR
jgi:hypothetical protein